VIGFPSGLRGRIHVPHLGRKTESYLNMAIWMMAELCGVTLREIGEIIGGLDYAAVAQRIRRTRLKYPEKEATDLIREMSNV